MPYDAATRRPIMPQAIGDPLSSSQSSATAPPPATPVEQFILWTLAMLRLEVQADGGDAYRLEVPEAWRDDFGGAAICRFSLRPGADHRPLADAPREQLPALPGTPLFDWLIRRLRETGPYVHAEPKGQPTNVHELSGALFGGYTIDGGKVHLAGCTLEDRPLLRVSYLQSDGAVRHRFFDSVGEPLDDSLEKALRLDQLVPFAGRPRSISAQLAGVVRRVGEQPLAAGGTQRLAVSLVWCKFAEGKLAFAIGDARAERAFAGWAQQVVDGCYQAPPLRCPKTGIASYHIAATDDGRITAAEAIGSCEVTGSRVLLTDLEVCQVTGKRVVSRELAACPVTGLRVARAALARCATCHQLVSPTCLQRGTCQACRNLQRVRKEDPRMARLLGECPGLDRWHAWRIAETSSTYILSASGIWRHLLIVVDRETLQIHRLATRGRLLSTWTDVPEHLRNELLI